MNWTQIETWIAVVAAVGLLIERLAAWRKAGAEAKRTRQDAIAAAVAAATTLYTELCNAQQERIGQLQAHLASNEARITALEHEKDELVRRYTTEIEALEGQIDDLREAVTAKQAQIAKLQDRVSELEAENARLREELTRICQARQQPTRAR